MPGTELLTLDATNADILNAIRTDASFAYQQRIPAVTQGDITETVQALTSNRPQMNEFIDTLVNRIGEVVFKTKSWQNPLAPFKRGMLAYGDTIEEIATTLIQGRAYDPNVCYEDVFKCNTPDVMVNFHRINRQNYYPITINDRMLQRAFVSSNGLSTMVSSLMETPYTSDSWDEYLIMRNLFVEYDRKDGFYRVQVPDIATATTREKKQDTAMAITEAVRAYASKLRFLSGLYNPMHVPTASNRTELYLFCTPDFTAMLDVNVIAFAFNVSAADVPLHIIEVDTLGIDGAQAILTDRDFFMCADTLVTTESIRNPKQLSWNYFIHHHGVYSVSKFVNAILFTTETGTSETVPTITTTSVTVDYATPENGSKPTFAEAGAKVQLVATVAGTVSPETDGYSVPQGVTWAITANNTGETAGVTLKQGTFVDAEGWLHVDPDETAKNVTVTATSTYVDPTKPMSGQTYKSGTLVIGIGEAYTPGA